MKKIPALKIITLLLTSITASAQEGSVQNLLLVRKGRDGSFPNVGDYQAGSSAFYIYRNCFYDFEFKNNRKALCKVIDIRNDSIYYSPDYIKTDDGGQRSGRYDTLSTHPSAIKKINLSGNIMTIPFVRCRLKRYNYSFVMSDSAKRFRTAFDTTYGYDSSYKIPYELIPKMTSMGVDRVYDQTGEIEYRKPPLVKKFIEQKPYKIKKVIWFTPSEANEIRGVNICVLQTLTFGGAPLTIRGVNVGIDIVSAYGTMMLMFDAYRHNSLSKMADTIDRSEKTIIVHGLHATIGGFVGDEVKGVALNGGLSIARQGYGLILTGFQNLVDDFRGVTISTLRNKSIKGAGLQIGLFNICKHLKGVQIGLWNVNSKRKLPFINWSFKSS